MRYSGYAFLSFRGNNMLTGRNTEINFLTGIFEKPGSHTVVVYGEKGVGKKSIFRSVSQTRRTFYYACRDCSDQEQRYQWNSELLQNRDFSARDTKLPQFPGYQDLLEASCREKDVLILDEFRFLLQNETGFMQDLRSFLDSQPGRQILVILVSSSVSWVENAMVRQMGREASGLSGLLKIKPLEFSQIRMAYPSYSLQDSILMYSILGGIPGYWDMCRTDFSLEENICHLFLEPSSQLQGEAQHILTTELRELNVYQSILAALASGKYKLNDIYHQTGFSRAKISVYLKNLIQMEVAEKIFPFDSEGRDMAQKGIYRISNPLIRFFYTYLFPNFSKLEMTSPLTFYQENIQNFLPMYAADAYRKICTEYLLHENTMGKLPLQADSYGEWPGKRGALDIILQNEGKGQNLLAFCSYHRKAALEDDEWVRYSAEQAKLSADFVWIFSDAGFDERLIKKAQADQHMKLVDLGSKNSK